MKSKRLLLLLLMALFAPWAANAQTTVEIGDGTVGSNRVPIDTYYNYSFSEQLYTADEIGTAGTITSISFNYINTVAKDFPIEVYMKNVDAADLSTGISLADADLVFEGTLSVSETGWVTIVLDTPFDYDGTSNLLIGINKGYVYWFSGTSWQGTTTNTTMARYSENDNNAYDTSTTPSSTSSVRPNIQMEITPSGGSVCEKPETFEVSNVTAHNATLAWTGGSGTYNIEYKKTTDSEWTLRMANYAGYGIMLVELDAETAYQARVQSVCDGDLLSNWKTVNFTTPVACPAPTGLNVALTPGDGTKATFSWTENGTATQWQLCLNGDETNLIEMTETPFTYTGLTPETAYTAKVRAYCDATDQSAWSNEVTFTPTNAYSITVNDGTTTNGYVPIYGYYVDEITKSQFIIPAENLADMAWGTINKMTFYASNSSVSWGNAQFEVYMTETSETTLSALADYGTMTKVKNAGSLSISGNQMVVEFDTPYSYMGGNLMIGFLQTATGTYSSCLWYGVSATGASMGGYGSSINQQNFLPKTTFDYIPGQEPECIWPTNLAVSNVTARTAELSWTSDATAWQIGYSTDGFVTEQYVEVTENPYTLTGLDPETDYEVRVQTNCGGGTYSVFTNPVSFTTTEACPAPTGFAASNITAHTADLAWTGFSESYTVQYRTAAYMDGIEEGFGTLSLPTGWTRYTGLVDNVMAGTATLASATSGWSFGTNNGVFDNHARTNIYGSSWNKWLVTPSFEVSGHLSFDLALTAYSGTLAAPQTTGTDDRFIVLVSTDEKATWTILREWNNSGSDYVYNDITCSATGESVTIDLSSYMGQTVYIAFYGESTVNNADNNLHIDNVTCGTPVPAGAWQDAVVEGTTANLSGLLAETKYEATVQGDCGTDGTSAVVSTTFTTDIACPAPTGLSYANVNSTSVDLSWTTGGAEDWIVAYKKDGDTEFTEEQVSTAQVTISGTTVTYTLTDLLEETAYTVKVADNCEVSVAGDGQSAWTAVVSFTTMAACSVDNVVVSDMTHYTATVGWDGESASGFTVKYRIPASLALDGLSEDFEDGAMPTGWTIEGPGSWTVGTGDYEANTGAHGGIYNAKIDHSNTGNETYLVTPNLDLSGQSGLNVNLWYINREWSGDIDGFGVYYRINGGEWNEIFATTEAHSTWTELNEELPAGAYAANVQFGFKMTDGYGYGVAIDDITIGNPSVIPAGAWQTVSATASPANIEGLEAGTKYDLTVVPNCDETLASAIQQFTTVSADEKWFVTEGNWGTASNWEPEGVPTISQNVTLLANATIESTCVAEAKSINGTGTGTNAKTLTIKDGGKLKHLNSNVRATVEKEIRPYSTNYDEESYNNGDYYLIANPLTSNVTPDAENNHLLSGNYDLYSWDYAASDDNEWRNYEANPKPFTSLNVGAYGYLYANETGATLTYTGTINAYTNSKSRYCGASSSPENYDFPGWYLLGNPYLYDAYLATAGTNGNALPYIKMNTTGDRFENVAAGTPIEPMEGFFYQQATTSGNVYVVTSAPTVQSNAKLNMNLRSANKQLDNAILVFGGDQQLGKMTFRANSSKIFMPVEGKDYAITSVEGQVGEVPVSFKAENNGTYSLSFTNEEVSFSYLHLIDNMTGADVDLLANPTYSFDARTTDYESRFRLVFATGSSVDGDSFGFINGMGNLTIFGIEGEATLQVIDVTGRMLSSETFSGSYEKRLNVAPGVYMLRLVNGNDVKVQKIVVR
jgi:hypothetical protein